MIIKCNEFVKRQTSASRFGHFEGTWEELEALVSSAFCDLIQPFRSGYRDGVFLVQVSHRGFFSSVVPIEGRELHVRYEARCDGEDKFPVHTVAGEKAPAKFVEIVLYSQAVLAENNEQTYDTTDYEIVSINPSPCESEVPMHPVTMARNQLELAGGTKGSYSSEEYAKAIVFWAQHAMVDPNL